LHPLKIHRASHPRRLAWQQQVLFPRIILYPIAVCRQRLVHVNFPNTASRVCILFFVCAGSAAAVRKVRGLNTIDARRLDDAASVAVQDTHSLARSRSRGLCCHGVAKAGMQATPANSASPISRCQHLAARQQAQLNKCALCPN
jgi:hypothetical protein